MTRHLSTEMGRAVERKAKKYVARKYGRLPGSYDQWIRQAYVDGFTAGRRDMGRTAKAAEEGWRRFAQRNGLPISSAGGSASSED